MGVDSALAVIRRRVRYVGGDNRATGSVPAAIIPGELLDAVETLMGRQVALIVFQGYRDGTAVCASHVDDYEQVILSLGATRTMEIDGELRRVHHGSLTRVPLGVSHAIHPDPDETGERISLVFRAHKDVA